MRGTLAKRAGFSKTGPQRENRAPLFLRVHSCAFAVDHLARLHNPARKVAYVPAYIPVLTRSRDLDYSG
jgi:hypothetical protein